MTCSNLENHICAIVTYNDSSAAISAAKMLMKLGYSPSSISIVENGSHQNHKSAIAEECLTVGFNVFDIKVNKGWGGAINSFVDQFANHEAEKILLVMAHDAIFKRFNIAEISESFKDDRLVFSCPAYEYPSSAYYTLLKSFHQKPIHKPGYICIGHQTAFFSRIDYLNAIKYDEEFWVYGGEYEIGLRASSLGYRTYQLEKNIIVNPGSSCTSLYSYLSYKLNSMYYAYKAKGPVGLIFRGLVLLVNIGFLLSSKEYQKSLYLMKIIMFSIFNPGCGHRTYVMSPRLQKIYRIHPLNS